MPNLIHVSKPYGQPVLVLLWISYPASLNLTDLISLIQESLPCFPHEPEITMVHWDDWREVSQITLFEAERWSTTGRRIDTLRNWYIKCHPFVGIKACNKNVSIFLQGLIVKTQAIGIGQCAAAPLYSIGYKWTGWLSTQMVSIIPTSHMCQCPR